MTFRYSWQCQYPSCLKVYPRPMQAVMCFFSHKPQKLIPYPAVEVTDYWARRN
jgi:hypothetical protein